MKVTTQPVSLKIDSYTHGKQSGTAEKPRPPRPPPHADTGAPHAGSELLPELRVVWQRLPGEGRVVGECCIPLAAHPSVHGIMWRWNRPGAGGQLAGEWDRTGKCGGGLCGPPEVAKTRKRVQ